MLHKSSLSDREGSFHWIFMDRAQRSDSLRSFLRISSIDQKFTLGIFYINLKRIGRECIYCCVSFIFISRITTSSAVKSQSRLITTSPFVSKNNGNFPARQWNLPKEPVKQLVTFCCPKLKLVYYLPHSSSSRFLSRPGATLSCVSFAVVFC